MTHSRRIPAKIKEDLIREAGNKCANPGCPNTRGQFHHIKEWHEYRTHDKQHMIVLCPVCHDQVRAGQMKIDDATLYSWKSIVRSSKLPTVDQIYIEPHAPIKLLLGSICFTGQSGAIIFKFSNNNKLSFQVEDNDICSLNISIADLRNEKIIQIINNYVKCSDKEITYNHRKGKVSVATSKITRFIPEWLYKEILKTDPSFTINFPYPLFELEVIKPGLVRVQGIWVTFRYAVVITDNRIIFSEKLGKTFSLIGQGEDTIMNWTGPLDISMFEFVKTHQSSI